VVAPPVNGFNLTWVKALYLSDGVTLVDLTAGLELAPNANVTFVVQVDAAGININSLSSTTSIFQGEFPLMWWPASQPKNPVSVNVGVTLDIVTVLVTPSLFSYNLKSGYVYNSSNLSPAPLALVFFSNTHFN